MSVTCPHCQSLVAADAVSGAAPEHCPYCDGTIAAVPAETMAHVVPETGDSPSVDSDAGIFDASDDAAVENHAPADDANRASNAEVTSDAQPASEITQPVPDPAPAATKRRRNTHPSFATPRIANAAPAANARWPWPLAASLLLLLLLQLVVADRASLAAQPRWRAAIAGICNILRCDIPPWRETGAFTMLARDVEAQPGTADALRIRAAFRNDARWPQPWPQLVVTLSDASGRVTGSRTFVADEYLGNTPTQKLIATGQTAAVELEIVDPALDTVSFSFDFR